MVSKTWHQPARQALWTLGIRFGFPNTFGQGYFFLFFFSISKPSTHFSLCCFSSSEHLVKLVDPIGTFFDGGIEPIWLTSPPASRHASPQRTKRDSCLQPIRPTSCSPASFSSHLHFQPSTDQPNYRPSGRRSSISLRRESGNYILEARISTEDHRHRVYSAFPSSSLSSSPIRLSEVDERHGRSSKKQPHHIHLERSISPIRDRIEIQSLSHAFLRASIAFSPQSSQSPPMPISPTQTDQDEFIFDPHLDDIYNPAPYITTISFSKFRSHGMRRSIGEGHQVRFVTPERLLRLLKSTRSRYASTSSGDSSDALHDLDHQPPEIVFRKGHLEAVGFSEYMDSAISKAVLDEIFLRGGVEVEYETVGQVEVADIKTRGRDRVRKELHTRTTPRDFSMFDGPQDSVQVSAHTSSLELSTLEECDQSKILRRFTRMESNLMDETPVRAIDLCGCVSPKFRTALTDFIADHALVNPYETWRQRIPIPSDVSVTPHASLRSTSFPWLARLGLSHMLILTDSELADLLSGFPNLVDLDLSHTRSGPAVLHTLQLIKKRSCHPDRCQSRKSNISSPLTSFRSLSLAKCRGLTEESLMGFLCGSAADDIDGSERWEDPRESIGGLEELSLYGDQTLPTPISPDSLDRLFSTCPCLTSGKLTTLDLSSIKIDDNRFDLLNKMRPQPNLIQFGLAACPDVSLHTLRGLLHNQLRMVEILDISGSCGSARAFFSRSNRLGSRSLPVLSSGLLHKDLIDQVSAIDPTGRRRSNLRVIELDEASLEGLAGGAQGWRVAFGKGERGW